MRDRETHGRTFFTGYYALNQLKDMPPSTISWMWVETRSLIQIVSDSKTADQTPVRSGSIQLFLQFAMGILSGPLFDRVSLMLRTPVHLLSES